MAAVPQGILDAFDGVIDPLLVSVPAEKQVELLVLAATSRLFKMADKDRAAAVRDHITEMFSLLNFSDNPPGNSGAVMSELKTYTRPPTRWEQLGSTHEQFNAIVAMMGPKTPNNVIDWWFFGDEPAITPPAEMWSELLKPFYHRPGAQ